MSIALTALDVKNGASVITTPASFVATANAVLHSGGTPKFVDIDMQTYNIDPESVKAAVETRTRAVIPVHLYGYPADIDAMKQTGEKKGFAVVEDACQAHGAYYKGRKVGGLGDVACFSFYPSKNMTVAGDGGMLVTNNEKIARKASKLGDCGRKSKYVHDLVGYTARLNTVNAAIGRVQLKYLDEWNEKRRRNAETYNRLLSDVEELCLPPAGDKSTRPVYHLLFVFAGAGLLAVALALAIVPNASSLFDLDRTMQITLLPFSIFIAIVVLKIYNTRHFGKLLAIFLVVLFLLETLQLPILYTSASNLSRESYIFSFSHIIAFYDVSDFQFAKWADRYTSNSSFFASDTKGHNLCLITNRMCVEPQGANVSDTIALLESGKTDYFLVLSYLNNYMSYSSKDGAHLELNSTEISGLLDNGCMNGIYDNSRVINFAYVNPIP